MTHTPHTHTAPHTVEWRPCLKGRVLGRLHELEENALAGGHECACLAEALECQQAVGLTRRGCAIGKHVHVVATLQQVLVIDKQMTSVSSLIRFSSIHYAWSV